MGPDSAGNLPFAAEKLLPGSAAYGGVWPIAISEQLITKFKNEPYLNTSHEVPPIVAMKDWLAELKDRDYFGPFHTFHLASFLYAPNNPFSSIQSP